MNQSRVKRHSAIAFQSESAATDELLRDQKPSQAEQGNSPQQARCLTSRSTITRALIDFAMLIVPIYFLSFGLLVYSAREQPADQVLNGQLAARLSEIAKVNGTVFPIVFAAIASNFLRALAAFRLEKGASVLQLDHLLNSRSPFSALTTAYSLKTANLTTLLLIILWVLSPIGGQASSRVVGTGPLYSNVTHNFTYLAFMSDFTNQGVGSASANLLEPINAIFESAISSSFSLTSPQDLSGNVKIPYYEYLNASSNSGSTWRQVPDDDSVPWSSLTGLPILGLPSNGTSRFVLSTGYMLPDCKVSIGDAPSFVITYLELRHWMYWSGGNFAINVTGLGNGGFNNDSFIFTSLSDSGSSRPVLTNANCTTKMSYVMVQVECSGHTCRSLAVKPSTELPSHNLRPCKEPTCTPLDGAGQEGTSFLSFFANLVNSTNQHANCDTVSCIPSIIEGYLANPQNPFPLSSTPIAISDQLMSQRLGQILNTYWIDSIAPFAVSGNFTMPAESTASYNLATYNVDSSIATIETYVTVITCDTLWFAALILISTLLLLIGIATGVLNMRRRGPNILDSFSTLIRDSVYCLPELPNGSSMEDGFDQSRRLRDVIVRLGDVKLDDYVGRVAVGVVNNKSDVGRLRPNREYD